MAQRIPPKYPLVWNDKNPQAVIQAINENFLWMIQNGGGGVPGPPGPPGATTFVGLDDVSVTVYDSLTGLEDYTIPVYNEGTGKWETGLKDPVATTDATPTELTRILWSTFVNEIIQVTAWVSARRSGGVSGSGLVGDAASFLIISCFRLDVTGITQIGTTTVLHSAADDPAWAVDFDIVTNAPDLSVMVTGATDCEIAWRHRILLTRIH